LRISIKVIRRDRRTLLETIRQRLVTDKYHVRLCEDKIAAGCEHEFDLDHVDREELSDAFLNAEIVCLIPSKNNALGLELLSCSRRTSDGAIATSAANASTSAGRSSPASFADPRFVCLTVLHGPKSGTRIAILDWARVPE
jgi:hypothetical protein